MKQYIEKNVTKVKESCIGCGVCVSVCPNNSITMKYTNYKEYRPIIDKKTCNNCGLCLQYCMQNPNHKTEEYNEVFNSKDYIRCGTENAWYYQGKFKKEEEVLTSCSGGITTALACKMLEKDLIDCVIHAKRKLAKRGEEHYSAIVSRSVEDIKNNRGSVYGPVNFDKVLMPFAGQSQRILFIGTPCAVRTVKNLFHENRRFFGNKLYTIALICSHNVTGAFTDYMGDSLSISKKKPYYADMRKKDKGQIDQNNFFTCYYDDNQVLSMTNRFANQWTDAWRNYFFSWNACLKCSDFYGRCADVSVKDSWGKLGQTERYGSTLLIVRNKEICSLLEEIDNIEMKSISQDDFVESQKKTADFKQGQIKNISKDTLNNEKRILKRFSNATKTIYKLFGYKVTSMAILFTRIKKIKERFKGKNILEVILYELHQFFGFKNISGVKKILVWGGFSGANAGDEAQIDQTYKELKAKFPEYEIKILSHVQQYTYEHHYSCAIGDNSRLAIWNFDKKRSTCYKLRSKSEKVRFLLTGYWMIFNSYLLRYFGITFCLGIRKAAFLYELATANCVYFSGGGYLTGETLSRLWDHLFVIHMASIFGIPCVMTGHNIGMWNSNFTRKFAKREFSKAKLITTRDKDISINYLAEIGVVGDHIFTTHDDALFCDKTIDISTIRNRCQLSAEEEYMVLSLCDWNKNPEHTVILLDRLKEIINIVLNNSNYIVELLPMAFEDEDICIQLLDACDNDRVRFVKFDDYDFRLIRGIISNSKVCITMRHHPIVFAMGECVPCISLFEDSYFRDKNIGALSLFDMQDYVVCLKDDDYLYEFEKMYKGMDLNAIRNIVSNQLNEMHSRKEEFYRRLKNILN